MFFHKVVISLGCLMFVCVPIQANASCTNGELHRHRDSTSKIEVALSQVKPGKDICEPAFLSMLKRVDALYGQYRLTVNTLSGSCKQSASMAGVIRDNLEKADLAKRLIASCSEGRAEKPSPSAKPSATATPPVRKPPASQQRVTCGQGGSTITGIGTGPVPKTDASSCNRGVSAHNTARSIRARAANKQDIQAYEDAYRKAIKAFQEAGDFARATETEKEWKAPGTLNTFSVVNATKKGDDMMRVASAILRNAKAEKNVKERISMLTHAASRFDDAAQYYRSAKHVDGEKRALRHKAEALTLAAAAAKSKKPPTDKNKIKCEEVKKYISDLRKTSGAAGVETIQKLEAQLKSLGCS